MKKPEYQITETDWGLLFVLNEGFIMDNSNFDTAIQVLLDSCKKYNKTKVLVDASKAIRRTSVLKMLETSEHLPTSSLDFKMAIIPPVGINDEHSKAMETFSFNRGVLLQYFADKESAMDWLIK
jgi:hypothetical protein